MRHYCRVTFFVLSDACSHSHHHHHQSVNREGRWGTTDPFFPVLHCPLGLAELQACSFPDVVFPPLPLSAFESDQKFRVRIQN